MACFTCSFSAFEGQFLLYIIFAISNQEKIGNIIRLILKNGTSTSDLYKKPDCEPFKLNLTKIIRKSSPFGK
jgi:hypothetical protein